MIESQSQWIDCPVCGCCDTRKETDRDGNSLIHCVNHACYSNGGNNMERLIKIMNTVKHTDFTLSQLKDENRRLKVDLLTIQFHCGEALKK